jgi:hypothetical protein
LHFPFALCCYHENQPLPIIPYQLTCI